MRGGGIRGLSGCDAMIALLFAGLASIAMANSIVFPLLGPLGRAVGLSDSQIGAMHAAAALGAIAAAPWWGPRPPHACSFWDLARPGRP